ncbi:MAG TPA: DNA repair protein RecO [Actinomycetota bacterium]|nr:DNA repair protein RecO [Actinomycetota bacterium]
MPLYHEQGVVLRRIKLAEADRIVTIMTQGSGKVRAVAKGARKTLSRFGARLEPMTHVQVLMYRGRGSLDTVTQAEIISAHHVLRSDYALITAGEAMLESTDKVAEEHERNVRLFLLLLQGLRALDAAPADPYAVAESFLLKLLSLSGFHPALTACAGCGGRLDPGLFSSAQGGAVCGKCADYDAELVPPESFALLASLAGAGLETVGRAPSSAPDAIRKQARAMLFGFAEYHLDRRIRSFPMLARGAPA